MAHADARTQELQQANAQLRARLGLAPEPDPAGAPALPWPDEAAAAGASLQQAGAAAHSSSTADVASAANATAIEAGGVVIEELEPEVPGTPKRAEPHEQDVHSDNPVPDAVKKQDSTLTDID